MQNVCPAEKFVQGRAYQHMIEDLAVAIRIIQPRERQRIAELLFFDCRCNSNQVAHFFISE